MGTVLVRVSFSSIARRHEFTILVFSSMYDGRVEKRKTANAQSDRQEELAFLKKEIMEEQQRVGNMTFDEAVAFVRANEIKVRADKRERIEQEIAELSKSPKLNTPETKTGKMKRKMRGSGKYLFTALKLAIPITTGLLLGVPVPFPFNWPGDVADDINVGN